VDNIEKLSTKENVFSIDDNNIEFGVQWITKGKVEDIG
jgi:hypothetical protein